MRPNCSGGAAAAFAIVLALKPDEEMLDRVSGQWFGVALVLNLAALMGLLSGARRGARAILSRPNVLPV